MKARTPIMALSMTSLHRQLHSSGPKKDSLVKLNKVNKVFTSHFDPFKFIKFFMDLQQQPDVQRHFGRCTE